MAHTSDGVVVAGQQLLLLLRWQDTVRCGSAAAIWHTAWLTVCCACAAQDQGCLQLHW